MGRNGAGKSTLLKILSKITPPSSGKVVCRGRIASLLEVGTGFHSELSGRENIYMNGSILGMRKSEIKKNFDKIVEFASVEKFIDTPLKHYSSGMQLRLAFAVAAFLENEILIIDEVLAVGDSEFQKKCIGKMDEISNSGRTILFVSHNISAIKNICNKGIVLQNGEIAFDGNVSEAIHFYQKTGSSNHNFNFNGSIANAPGNESIKILSFEAKSLKFQNDIYINSGILFDIIFYNASPNINLDVTIELTNNEDIVIFHSGIFITTNNDSKEGKYHVQATIPPNILNAGIYQLKVIFGKNRRELLYMHNNIIQFEILNEKQGELLGNTLPGVLHHSILAKKNSTLID